MLQNFAVILTSAVLLLAGATSAAPPKSTAVSTDVTTPPKPVKSHIRTSAVSTDYTLGEVLEDQPNLELLYKLYQARPSLFKQLENDINDGKPITFLAPSDDAFRKLIEGSNLLIDESDKPMEDTLKVVTDLITYHTIQGRHTAEELFNNPIFPLTFLRGRNTTLDGRPQVIRTVKQNDVGYVYGGLNKGTFFRKWDIILTKGLMHIMDGILHLPESVSETALKLGVPEFPRLLKEQNHVSKVDNIGDSTFFVPKELIDRMPTNTIELSDIIAYHVAEGIVLWAKDLKGGDLEIPTVFGAKLRSTYREGELYINDALVIGEDIITTHGVIHILERMLDPREAPGYKDAKEPKTERCKCIHKFCKDDKTACSVTRGNEVVSGSGKDFELMVHGTAGMCLAAAAWLFV